MQDECFAPKTSRYDQVIGMINHVSNTRDWQKGMDDIETFVLRVLGEGEIGPLLFSVILQHLRVVETTRHRVDPQFERFDWARMSRILQVASTHAGKPPAAWTSSDNRSDAGQLAESGPRIVVIDDRLMETAQSRTRAVLNIAVALTRWCPSARILIASARPSAKRASSYRAMHERYVSSRNVQFVYFDDALYANRGFGAFADMLRSICGFRPAVILYTVDFSWVFAMLSDRYPSIRLLLWKSVPIQAPDVIVGSFGESDAHAFWAQCGAPPTLIQRYHRPPASFHRLDAPQRRRDRQEFGISADAFVVVTVGNGLRIGLTKEFCAIMFRFLESDSRRIWLIVGDLTASADELAEMPIVQRLHQSPVHAQIRLSQHEEDLPAVLDLCDAFANPPYWGGGTVIIWAMGRAIPVVSFRQALDATFCLPDSSIAVGDEDYLSKLARLHGDHAYRREMAALVKGTATAWADHPRYAKDMLSTIEQARRHFITRTGDMDPTGVNAG
jgi:hypothetical protein